MVGKRPRFWDRKGALSMALMPLAGLFGLLVAVRRGAYRLGIFRSHRLPVPVLVVGNITVGGSGKTPLVLWIVEFLAARGWMPGIVSRGYGGRSSEWPQRVTPDSDPRKVGDEPVLLARRAACPVAVGPNRPKACELLLAAGCDIVVSDDGMQHYALERDLEIMVSDGRTGLGNGRLIPAGPLREPYGRSRNADLIVANGEPTNDADFHMEISVGDAVSVAQPGLQRSLSSFAGQEVDAVAGIGHPERFFHCLQEAGLQARCHAFPDHHEFRPRDMDFRPHRPILMTEKDAVKYKAWFPKDCWYVPVEAKLSDQFAGALDDALRRITAHESTR